MKFQPEWFAPLALCAENMLIIDEESKKLLWSSDIGFRQSESCFQSLFGKDSPCENCPILKENELYTWDYYDKSSGRWYKIKNLLFRYNGRVLRAVNLNEINDAMRLNYESIAQISELQNLLNENRRIKKSLEQEANQDRMTGLLNRNRFNLDLASGMFDHGHVGILYFDLNNLKEVNDMYRHEAGDKLICCLSRAIAATVQNTGNAYAYRVGGDEFLLLKTECTKNSLTAAHQFFDDFLAEHQTDPRCIVAVGQVFTDEPYDAEKLVSDADRAMYADKKRLKELVMS